MQRRFLNEADRISEEWRDRIKIFYDIQLLDGFMLPAYRNSLFLHFPGELSRTIVYLSAGRIIGAKSNENFWETAFHAISRYSIRSFVTDL